MKSAAARIERSTCVSAAKLATASQPAPARATSSGSAMSPWTNSCSIPARLAGLPEYVSLSRTTTSSPCSTSRLTKWLPMKPAPPVTSTRTARSLPALHPRSGRPRSSAGRAEAHEARAKTFPPVREARRPGPLAPQHRIPRARRGPAEVGRRHSAHPALEPRLLEDRLGELGPGAVAGGGHVPDAAGELEKRPCRL